jgi:hypothetical protein
MRLHATAPAPHNGWNEDAFFALVPMPPPPNVVRQALAAGVLVVPALAGIPPKGGTTNTPVASFSAADSFASVSFVGARVSSAPLSSTLPAPVQNSGVRYPTATGIWSLDSASADRHLTNFSQSRLSLTLTRAAMRGAGVPDEAWQDAFGIGDFALEEL